MSIKETIFNFYYKHISREGRLVKNYNSYKPDAGKINTPVIVTREYPDGLNIKRIPQKPNEGWLVSNGYRNKVFRIKTNDIVMIESARVLAGYY